MLYWLHKNKKWAASNSVDILQTHKAEQEPAITTITPDDSTHDERNKKEEKETKVVPLPADTSTPDLSVNIYEASFASLKEELGKKEEVSKPTKPKHDLNEESQKPKPGEKETAPVFDMKTHQDKVLSLTDWLKLTKDVKTGSGIKEETPAEKEEGPFSDFKLPKQEEVLKALRSLSKGSETKITPDKEHFGIVTETLAKILIKQGKPEKAIKVYEELRLQNPEKSAYFEARIKELKEQL